MSGGDSEGKSLRLPIYRGWRVVVSSAVGLSIGPGQFAFSTLGLVMISLSREFGWNRTEVSLSLTIMGVLMTLCMPVMGAVTDRYGSRRVVIPSLFIFAVLLALMSVISRLWELWAIFAMIGTLAIGTNSLPYLQAISKWFDRRRGLALGIALAGNGLGSFYAAQVVRIAVANAGWREAYLALSLTVLAASVLIWWLLEDAPVRTTPGQCDASAGKPALDPLETEGLSRISTLKTWTFWALFLIFAVVSFSLYGLLPHLAPMLIDRGVPSASALNLTGCVGISSLFARVAGGYLLDRVHAPYVAFVCISASALGMMLLALNVALIPFLFLATTLVSIGLGSEMDLLAYLTGRYFGLRYFGQIFAVLFISLMLGTALGPAAFGYAYEASRSYRGILVTCGVLTMLAAVLTLLLPKFPHRMGRGD